MGKARRKKAARAAEPPLERAPPRKANPFFVALGLSAFAVLVFYWTPLTDPETTPQWDTIDHHYSVQKFAAEELTSLRLPHWSEFSYSGYPFLADPQVGAWYPPNWPFFAAGVTPKSLQWQIALHVLLALVGAWLLARLWLPDAWSAAAVAVLYGFSGFFAGHASHLGMLQTAAWLPLVLYAVHVSLRTLRPRTMALSGLACACLFLAGHFQTALYSFAAVAVYAGIVAALERRWRAAVSVLAVCAALTLLLSSIQWLPALELLGQSPRAGVSYADRTNAPLEWGALWTLLSPDHLGTISGNYKGPEDRTQFYFYAGLSAIPLAILGLAAGRLRWVSLAFIFLFGWYAFGPAGGFYRLAARLPGLGAVRAPVHAWFVVALGLALLAGAGLAMLSGRLKFRWLAPAVTLLAFADLMYWNSVSNPLAWHRGSFESRYGNFQNGFAAAARASLPEGTRFYSPWATAGYGPLNGAYDLRLPVTYGYNPLPLRRYLAYLEASESNPNLVNALNAGKRVVPETGAILPNPSLLPRFFFPKRLTAVGAGQAAALLASANPPENALVEGDLSGLNQDPAAAAVMESSQPQRYVVRSQAQSPSLLRAAIPWYPSWRARVDGRPVETRIVDAAMIGIPVPAGRHEVVLEFVPARFRLGAAISLLTLSFLVAASFVGKRFAP